MPLYPDDVEMPLPMPSWKISVLAVGLTTLFWLGLFNALAPPPTEVWSGYVDQVRVTRDAATIHFRESESLGYELNVKVPRADVGHITPGGYYRITVDADRDMIREIEALKPYYPSSPAP